ncbi:MAG: hypothetical protein IT488_04765 [Gammaproteobacteria bacterium]|nr:hypothetical protein [Gammaproteobacteria bacterium]
MAKRSHSFGLIRESMVCKASIGMVRDRGYAITVIVHAPAEQPSQPPDGITVIFVEQDADPLVVMADNKSTEMEFSV